MSDTVIYLADYRSAMRVDPDSLSDNPPLQEVAHERLVKTITSFTFDALVKGSQQSVVSMSLRKHNGATAEYVLRLDDVERLVDSLRDAVAQIEGNNNP